LIVLRHGLLRWVFREVFFAHRRRITLPWHRLLSLLSWPRSRGVALSIHRDTWLRLAWVPNVIRVVNIIT
jgi:hypothetical protein